MAIDPTMLGREFPGKDYTFDRDACLRYAASTNDAHADYAEKGLAPPVMGAVATWDAMVAAMDNVIPEAFQKRVMHAERDMHFLRPLRIGSTISSRSSAYCWRVGPKATRYTLRIQSNDADGKDVLDQYITMFIGKMTEGESQGPDKPEHGIDDAQKSKVLGRFTLHFDVDQTFRYRDASGDMMDIHVDEEAAKRVGLPGIIAHGVCTMAMAGASVVNGLEKGPADLRRLAVRWSKPVFPDCDLVTACYDLGTESGAQQVGFETLVGDAPVMTMGRAVFGPPAG